MATSNLVLCDLQNKVKRWAQDPAAALTCEGRGTDLVCNYPLRLAVETRLRVVFGTMATTWYRYIKEYAPGGTLDVEASTLPQLVIANPTTNVSEERFVGLLCDVLKLAGKRMAPWLAVATATSRPNVAVDLPLQNNNLKFVIDRARAVEKHHGGTVHDLNSSYGKHKAKEAQAKETMPPQGQAVKRCKVHNNDRAMVVALGGRCT